MRVVLDTDVVVAMAAWARLDHLWRPMLKDPADERVLETAVNGWTEILVTFNLVDLASAAARFGIRAVRPGVLLRLAAFDDA